MRLRASAREGRANDELVRLLAERLGVSRDAVTLVSGFRGRHKVARVAGLSAGDARLSPLLAGR